MLVPIPVFFIFRVTVCTPDATGPVSPPAPVEPIVMSDVPRPAAPMQSFVAAVASGVPLEVALPHWVTPMNTVDSVVPVVVRVTVTI